MVFPKTLVKISDNSGALLANIFYVFKGGSKGTKVRVSIRKVRSLKKSNLDFRNFYKNRIERKSTKLGIVVRCMKKYQRLNGICLRFFENAIALLSKKNKPLAKRIYGPIGIDIYRKKFIAISFKIL
jgi:ribosomal protein L14